MRELELIVWVVAGLMWATLWRKDARPGVSVKGYWLFVVCGVVVIAAQVVELIG